MAEITKLVCDRCGSAEGVGVYRISTPETGERRAVGVDLCAACAVPIEEFAEVGRVVAREHAMAPRRGSGGEALRAKIYTQEELDAIEDAETQEAPPATVSN